MRVLMPLSLGSAAFVCLVLPTRSKAFAFALAGFALMVCALVVTLSVNVPIDNQIKRWTVATLPSDWQAIRDRWEFYHALRTFLSIAALGLVTASSLSDDRTSRSL
jgi:uncharacterized membrane protein